MEGDQTIERHPAADRSVGDEPAEPAAPASQPAPAEKPPTGRAAAGKATAGKAATGKTTTSKTTSGRKATGAKPSGTPTRRARGSKVSAGPAQPAPAIANVPPPTPAIAADPPSTPAVTEDPPPPDADLSPMALPLPAAVRAFPQYAPELLAVSAVQRLGAAAVRRIAWLRDRYPDATPGHLAAMSTREFVRRSRYWAVASGLGGPVGAIADVGGHVWLEARLVLDLAAAHGLDPTDRRRAADLLVLKGVHRDVDQATTAIETVLRLVGGGGQDSHGVRSRLDIPVAVARRSRVALRALGSGLLQAGARKAASRLVPGASAVVALIGDSRAAERFADQATRYYAPR